MSLPFCEMKIPSSHRHLFYLWLEVYGVVLNLESIHAELSRPYSMALRLVRHRPRISFDFRHNTTNPQMISEKQTRAGSASMYIGETVTCGGKMKCCSNRFSGPPYYACSRNCSHISVCVFSPEDFDQWHSIQESYNDSMDCVCHSGSNSADILRAYHH